MRAVRAFGLLCCLLPACTPPVRQYPLNDQRLTCEQANTYTYRTLQGMGFAITAFEPAHVGKPGEIKGARDERTGTQYVTVGITCDAGTASIDPSDDRGFLSQVQFKRGFYLAFTGMVAQAAVVERAAREEAQRPLQQKKEKGLRVLLEPMAGLAAKGDFDLDLSAANVLPVRVTINNATPRTYDLDLADVVLIRTDGTRTHAMNLDEAARRVAEGERQNAAKQTALPDPAAIALRLRARLLADNSISPNQLISGYLFFPTASYAKGRVTLTDRGSEETEGFVVEF